MNINECLDKLYNYVCVYKPLVCKYYSPVIIYWLTLADVIQYQYRLNTIVILY